MMFSFFEISMWSDVDGSRQKGIKVIKKILIEFDLNFIEKFKVD